MSEALQAVPDLPDTKALTSEAEAIVVRATALVVESAADYEAAAEFGKGIKSLRTRIVDFFAPHKKRAKAVHDALCSDEREQLAPVDRAIEIVKGKMITFSRAERERQEAEQKRQDAERRRLDEERRLQEAIELEEDGDTEAANATLDAPAPLPFVPVARPVTPKVSGAATTRRWTFDADSVDVAAVIKHIAGIPQSQALAHPELANLLSLDTKVARQLITAMRENFNVPGVRAYEAESVALSGK